jgi:hypothetical protein
MKCITAAAIFSAMVIISNVSYGQNAFVCASDMINGFEFDKRTKVWEHARFTPGYKYLVRREHKRPNVTWTVAQIGLKLGPDVPTATCQFDFSPEGLLYCTGAQYFEINKNTLRFAGGNLSGYIHGGQLEGLATPFVEIGKCSPLN